MRKLILVRGLPGSGKSTFAMHMANAMSAFHFEADQYFVDNDGIYKFDPSKLKQAHDQCFDSADWAMCTKDNDVIVSNTFTQEWEMNRYFESAKKHGFQVVTLIVENRHGSESVHNVPAASISKMKHRFEIQL